MMKIKHVKYLSVFLFSLTTAPIIANAESLDEYIEKRPAINNDPIVGSYVKQMAWSIALMEVQQKYGSSSDNKVRVLLDLWGEKYGALSIRKLANDCRIELETGFRGQLSKRECKLLIANDRK